MLIAAHQSALLPKLIIAHLNFTTGHLLSAPSSQSDASSSPINKTKTDSLDTSVYFYTKRRVCVFQVANTPPAFLIHDPGESGGRQWRKAHCCVGGCREREKREVARPPGRVRCKGVALVDVNRKVLAVRLQKANMRERTFSFCTTKDCSQRV